MGRPPLIREERLTSSLHLRMTDEEYDRACRYAIAKKLTIARVVRLALVDFLNVKDV